MVVCLIEVKKQFHYCGFDFILDVSAIKNQKREDSITAPHSLKIAEDILEDMLEAAEMSLFGEGE